MKRILIVCLLLVVAEARGEPKSGEAYQLESRSPLTFRLNETRFALGVAQLEKSMQPVAEQQLLIVRFTVRNDGEKPRALSALSLRFSVVDKQHRVWDRVTGCVPDEAAIAKANKGEIAPGASRDLRVSIVIPENGEVSTLVVARSGSPKYALHYPLEGAVLASGGPKVDDGIIAGQAGSPYPLRTIDVGIEGSPLLVRQAGVWTTNEKRRLLAVPVWIRNRSDRELATTSFLRGSSIEDAAGAIIKLRGVVSEHGNALNDRIKPDGTLRAVALFDVPADIDAKRVTLVEANVSRGVSFDLPGRLSEAAVESGIARPQKIAETVNTPGVFDPRSIGKVPSLKKLPAPRNAPLKLPSAGGGKKKKELKPKPEQQQPAARPEPAAEKVTLRTRTGSVAYQRIAIDRAGEIDGDEYHAFVFSFQGRIRSDNPPLIFRADRDFAKLDEKANWARGGVEGKTLPSGLCKRTFPDLRPYEIYGSVMVMMERDAATREMRLELGSSFNRALVERWNQLMASDGEYDYGNQDPAHARELTKRVARKLKDGFLYGLQKALRQELKQYLGTRTRFADDYVGTVAAFWVNLPEGEGLDADLVLTACGLTLELGQDGGFRSTNYALDVGIVPPGTYEHFIFPETNLEVGGRYSRGRIRGQVQ